MVLLNLTILGFDEDFAVAALDVTKCYNPIDFRYSCWVVRVTCLEQFSNPWQTACNVFHTSKCARYFSQRFTVLHLLALFHYNVGANRNIVVLFFLLGIDYFDRWDLCFVPRFDDNFLPVTGLLVYLFLIGYALFNILKLDFTCICRDNYSIIRIPWTNAITLINFLAIFHIEYSSVRNMIGYEHFFIFRIFNPYFACTAYDNILLGSIFIRIGCCFEAIVLQNATELSRQLRFGFHTRGGPANVECTKRQLCTGLTNGLSSNNAHSIALLGHTVGCKVSPVTPDTNTFTRFTRQYGTDFYFLNWGLILNLTGNIFIDFFASFNNQFIR